MTTRKNGQWTSYVTFEWKRNDGTTADDFLDTGELCLQGKHVPLPRQAGQLGIYVPAADRCR